MLYQKPYYCFVKHPVTKQTMKVKRGKKGFFDVFEVRPPDELNKRLGVTDEQKKELISGAINGWCEEEDERARGKILDRLQELYFEQILLRIPLL